MSIPVPVRVIGLVWLGCWLISRMSIPVPVGVIGLVWLGCLLISRLNKRVTGDARLGRLLLISFGLRVLLGVSMFMISYWQWPILSSLQIGDGFWTVGLDSRVYDLYGARLANSWLHGIELPAVDLGVEYVLVVGSLYRLLGPHPLYPIIFNGWLAVVVGILAYVIGRRLFGQRQAVTAALLVAFWPSSFIWSAQLLKDCVSWFVILLALILILMADPEHPKFRKFQWPRQAAVYLALGVLVVYMTRLRFYLGTILSLTVLVVLLPVAISALMKRAPKQAAGYAGIVLVVVISTLFARTFHPFDLLAPAHPERGHFKLAMKHWEQNDAAQQDGLAKAEQEFHHALSLDKAYDAAYLRLGALNLEQGALMRAIRTYERYLKDGAPSSERRRQVKVLIRQIHAQLLFDDGQLKMQIGEFAEAVNYYQQALTYEPSSAAIYANLGQALARLGNYEQALANLGTAMKLSPPKAISARIYAERAAIRQILDSPPEVTAALMTASEAARREDAEERVELARAEAAEISEPPALEMDEPAAEAVAEPIVAVEAAPVEVAARPVSPPRTLREVTAVPAHSPERVLPEAATTSPREAGGLMPVLSGGEVEASESPDPWLREDSAQLLFEIGLETDLSAEAFTLFDGKGFGANKGSRRHRNRLTSITRSLSQIDEQAMAVKSETTTHALGTLRSGFVHAGGYSLMDPRALISHPKMLVDYLPRALAIGFLAPFPWQWFDAKGSTGIMRTLAGVEMIFLYLLLPGLIGGIVRTFRHRRPNELLLLTFVVMTLVPLSLVVANLGTLFRLRLMFLLPLLIVIANGRPFDFYRRIGSALRDRSAAVTHT